MTPNFTLFELTGSEIASRRGLDNTPGTKELSNLKRLAEFLEEVRALLGKPILINSAYRSKAVNEAVGSSDRSQHLLGCAADLRVPGMTPRAVCEAVMAANLPYHQLILEFDAWTHISVPNIPDASPRRQALIIDKQGVRAFS
jgi:zinc D-Ala-D-Ala carboxypeptidase